MSRNNEFYARRVALLGRITTNDPLYKRLPGTNRVQEVPRQRVQEIWSVETNLLGFRTAGDYRRPHGCFHLFTSWLTQEIDRPEEFVANAYCPATERGYALSQSGKLLIFVDVPCSERPELTPLCGTCANYHQRASRRGFLPPPRKGQVLLIRPQPLREEVRRG